MPETEADHSSAKSSSIEPNFKQRVQALVRQIPPGRVMTYGQLAALTGNANAARIVGGIAHFGDPELPWQRVVNKQGGLASGYPGGRTAHAEHLRSEGVEVYDDYYVDVAELIWWPDSQAKIRFGKIVTGPLIVVIGETASGKSAVGLDLARRFNGEIIAADSWTVYKGFDIGSAKPSKEERAEIKHHLIDIVDAKDGFNAAQYKKLALEAIADIESRGKLPIMVGGTGLYVNSVLYDFSFMPAGPADLRAARNAMSIEELLAEIQAEGISLDGIDIRNKRRLIRLLESGGERPSNKELRENSLMIGLRVEREYLRLRVEQRVDTMLAGGLQNEVQKLARQYGWDVEPMKGIGYREWREYFEGSQNLELTRARIISATMGLAKRQRTWFKRNSSIQWARHPNEVVDLATTFLNN